MSILELENICFSYGKTPVIKDLSLAFEEGHIYAIVGRSGAGKTTLLSLLSGLASPDSGTITFQGEDIRKINKYDFRRKCVGVIFQNFNLLTNLSALENVVLSMEISGNRIKDKKARAYNLLEKVGLNRDEADRRVLKLSGGQQQRVAIARALSYDPSIILADEPTGNLDGETQDEIMQILRGLAEEGKCVIIVTHSPEVSRQSDFVYTLNPLTAKKQ